MTESIVVGVDGGKGKIAAAARERLDTAVVEAVGDDGCVVIECSVLHGDPAQTLCDRSASADLLVVGSRGRGGFARLLLGSVSSAYAQRSRCKFVIVPGPRPDLDAPTRS